MSQGTVGALQLLYYDHIYAVQHSNCKKNYLPGSGGDPPFKVAVCCSFSFSAFLAFLEAFLRYNNMSGFIFKAAICMLGQCVCIQECLVSEKAWSCRYPFTQGIGFLTSPASTLPNRAYAPLTLSIISHTAKVG